MRRTAWLWLSLAMGIACGAARADSEFLPLPVPPPAPAPAPAGGATAEEVKRVVRETRQRLEERLLEHSGRPGDVEAYRLRERRELDRAAARRERSLERMPAPQRDAERVRADIERARAGIDLERRLEGIEREKGWD